MFNTVLNRNTISKVYNNIVNTPLEYNERLSLKYNATIYIKNQIL